MKIKTLQAINARVGVMELLKKPMNYETARHLFKWRMFLKTELQNAELFEKTLIEKYGGKRKTKKEIEFPDEESTRAFNAEMDNMLNTEIETELKGIDVSKIDESGTLMLKGEIWELLEPILLKAEETA